MAPALHPMAGPLPPSVMNSGVGGCITSPARMYSSYQRVYEVVLQAACCLLTLAFREIPAANETWHCRLYLDKIDQGMNGFSYRPARVREARGGNQAVGWFWGNYLTHLHWGCEAAGRSLGVQCCAPCTQ